jgi:hypothetical protein
LISESVFHFGFGVPPEVSAFHLAGTECEKLISFCVLTGKRLGTEYPAKEVFVGASGNGKRSGEGEQECTEAQNSGDKNRWTKEGSSSRRVH